MKHLIIFPGYGRSRLDNPVYRQLTQSPFYHKEVILLFLSARLDERELLHQINELQKSESADGGDIAFHLCSNLSGASDGDNILQVVRTIRRQSRLQPDATRSFPICVYGLMPPIDTCSAQTKLNLWHNLSTLNQASVQYHDSPWVQCIYLHHDSTLVSLSNFLYYVISTGLPIAHITPKQPFEATDEAMFVPVFGSFNCFGVSYPEAEMRRYLHTRHLRNVLRCADSSFNQFTTTDCVNMAGELSRVVPSDLLRIALQEAVDHNNYTQEIMPEAQPADSRSILKQRIEYEVDDLKDDLKDLRRSEWAERVEKEMEASFQSRLLPGGVEYYVNQQLRKCSHYSSAISQELSREFDRMVCARCLPADALRQVVRALINLLQQRALDLERHIEEEQHNISTGEHYCQQLRDAWEHTSLLNRLTGRDQKTWEHYRAAITQLYLAKSLVCGTRFALTLLNEIIVHVSALDERCTQAAHILTETATTLNADNNDFTEAQQAIMNSAVFHQASAAMQQDHDVHLRDYAQVIALLFGPTPTNSAAEFLQTLQSSLAEKIDQYLDENMRTGRFPALLNQPLVERLRQRYADEGGFDHFLLMAKQQAAISLMLKEGTDNKTSDRFILLSSLEAAESVDQVVHIDDAMRVVLLHVLCGVSLQDLDGFSGYRIAFEPAMF